MEKVTALRPTQSRTLGRGRNISPLIACIRDDGPAFVQKGQAAAQPPQEHPAAPAGEANQSRNPANDRDNAAVAGKTTETRVEKRTGRRVLRVLLLFLALSAACVAAAGLGYLLYDFNARLEAIETRL